MLELVERFGIDAAHAALPQLAMPDRVGEEHALLGYVVQYITVACTATQSVYQSRADSPDSRLPEIAQKAEPPD